MPLWKQSATTLTNDDPWFRPQLRTKAYGDFGDAYSDELYRDLCGTFPGWNVEPIENQSYLRYVKQIKDGWPHLRLLADFMQIGTHPQRWQALKPIPETSGETAKQRELRVDREYARTKRLEKTKVVRLDYYDGYRVDLKNFDFATKLEEDLPPTDLSSDIQLRLYVVEDLSRDLIEVLGSKMNIEPSFFRAHIVDYAWYNVRDRWRDPPNLDVIGRQQNWLQLRYVTARYFQSREDFENATKESENFNILRRPDDDISNTSWWDDENAIIGLTRSRATFWLKPGHIVGKPAVGVLLLDPTVDNGIPLWRGRRNWYPTPSPDSEPNSWPNTPQDPRNFYDDFLWWAQKPEVFSLVSNSITNIHVPMQALLHLICSEWRTMSDYIKTRLCQIELEIVKPKKFATNQQADASLEKLNMWRRFIPLYREMISETLEQVFRFPCHTETFSRTTFGSVTPDQVAMFEVAERTKTGVKGEESDDTTASQGSTQADSAPPTHRCPMPVHPTRPCPGSISAYRNDFLLALCYMEEYQRRIDRMTQVVTAAMQIADSRRALDDARNLGRLTWLATIFIPFSLTATLFAMHENVTVISGTTVWLYFAVSMPLAILTFCIAWVLAYVPVTRWLKALWDLITGIFGRRRDGKG